MAQLREQTFLILVALADVERHGYGIIGEVEQISAGAVTLGPGTLYGALDRLSADGLVEATRTEVVDGRQRRYYRLTDEGRGTLHHEASRRAAMADAVGRRLGGVKGLAPA